MVVPWNDYSGRLSPLKLVVFVALFVPAGVGAVRLWLRAARRAAVKRGDPPDRVVDDTAHFPRLGGDAAAPNPRMAAADPGAADDRGGRLRLCADPFHALCRERDVRPQKNCERDRAAGLSDDRLCRIARPRGTRRDLDRRHDPPPGRQTLAAVLHRLVYAVGVLAVIHYCFQSKLDLWQPTVMAGLLGWLLGYRLLLWCVGRTRASGFALDRRAEPRRRDRHGTRRGGVFPSRLSRRIRCACWTPISRRCQAGIRPAVVVLAIGLAVTAAGALRAATARPTPRRLRTAAAAAPRHPRESRSPRA